MLLFLKIGYPKLDAVSTKSIKVAITRAKVEKSPPSSEPNMTHESPGLKLAMAQAGLRRGQVDASICQGGREHPGEGIENRDQLPQQQRFHLVAGPWAYVEAMGTWTSPMGNWINENK